MKAHLPRRNAFLIWGVAITALGLTLGITDDEAYYWVLGQSPALGYAYHPPAIGWSVWLADVSIGPILRAIFGDTYWTRVWVTRAASFALMLLSLRLLLGFLREVAPQRSSYAMLLAFPGVFATCWMMVPDTPLILGWTLLFVGTYAAMMGTRRAWDRILLGSAILLWSKFSGLIAVGSAFFCLARKKKWGAIAALAGGIALGVIPILIWNAQHDWMSLRYQFVDRHQGGGGISWSRGLRFFLIQLVAAGPLLFAMPLVIFRTNIAPALRNYFLIWFAPAAAVFFVQPFYADFKPHWALIAWWPLAIAMSALGRDGAGAQFRRWAKFQAGWTIALTCIVWSSLLFPWVTRLGVHFKGKDFNPTLDIGNDMKAWGGLAARWQTDLTEEERALPVTGSRYQTASQAAFALDGIAVARSRVGLLPKSINARDEWPDFDVTEVGAPEFGEWGRLKSSILFVADNRYSAPPEFGNAKCFVRMRHSHVVAGLIARQITVYRCDPASP